jgi:hypothetical protein
MLKLMGSLFVSFYVTGCVSSKAWIVDKRLDGGVIGYKMGNSDNAKLELAQAVQSSARQICGARGYSIVRDRLNSQQESYTYLQPQTSTTNSTYNYNGTSSAYGSSYGNGGYATGSAYGASYGTMTGTQTTTSYIPVTNSYTNYWREAEITCTGTAVASDGRQIGRPILGIKPELGFSGKGVMVKEVIANSPADHLGIRSGDVITEIGFKPIEDFPGMLEVMGSFAEGVAGTAVKYCRGGSCTTSEVDFNLAH